MMLGTVKRYISPRDTCRLHGERGVIRGVLHPVLMRGSSSGTDADLMGEGLSDADAVQEFLSALGCIAHIFKSDEMVLPVMRVPSGAVELDDLLGGGIESGSLTLLYGEGGSGKTNICLQVARNIVESVGRKVIYVDTESVSADRLAQIFGGDSPHLKRVLFFRPHTFQEQERLIEKVCRMCDKVDIGGIMVDSATVYYRLDMRDPGHVERASLTRQVLKLMRVARTKDIPVMLTTQVYYDSEKGSIEPIGGHMLFHNAKTILKLERVGGTPSRRRAVLVKHRSIPEGGGAMFTLTSSGVE